MDKTVLIDIKDRVLRLKKKFGKNKLMAVMFAVGVILLIMPWNTEQPEKTQMLSVEAEEFSLREQEEKLEEILSKMDGAGKVRVMLTLRTSAEKMLASDESVSSSSSDLDTDNESERKTVTVSAGSGVESTVTVKYLYPEYLGAVVVAEGAENPTVRLKLSEAVAAATGLGASKIKVTN